MIYPEMVTHEPAACPDYNLQHCRTCGCCDAFACDDGFGPCHWVELDLCSHCAEDLAA